MDAYSALIGDEPEKVAPRNSPPQGSFADLATRYFVSPKYLALAPSSRTNYRRVIDSFLTEHGHRLVRQMTLGHLDVIMGRMASRPGAGIVLLKRIRTLLRYAIKLGWIDRDPSSGADTYRSNEIHTWTEQEIATFEGHWPIGTRQRLAFAILLYTGQRGSDAHRMARPDVRNKIRVVQQKTKQPLVISVHPALQRAIEAVPNNHVAILTTAFGKPFTVKGFGQFVSSAIQEAGLPPECKAHGLRKAAARRLAEIGCSVHEIMSVTGHKTLSEVERYTRAAGQERLNEQALEKQVEAVTKRWTIIRS